VELYRDVGPSGRAAGDELVLVLVLAAAAAQPVAVSGGLVALFRPARSTDSSVLPHPSDVARAECLAA
jgi:hypothetical protein